MVIPIIKAMADPTRLEMLLYINESAPKGLTASQLADKLGKKIPTILHHLDKLNDLGLVNYSMEKIGEAGRPVKHWKVEKHTFQLKVDMNTIADFTDFYGKSLSDYSQLDELILYLFEEEKRRKSTIDYDYVSQNTPESILAKLTTYKNEVKPSSFLDITIFHAQEIHSRLRENDQLEKYLQKWILKTFRDSGATLQLDFFELGEWFRLGQELRRRLYEFLIESNKFSSIVYDDSGQPIQRLKLREEFLDSVGD
jgi:DNA-binding transcriptional ArsR family regulator